MNTVITNADYTHPKDLYNRIKAVFPFWDILSLWEQERIQKACDKQDSFTRLELAKAVREIEAEIEKEWEESADNNVYYRGVYRGNKQALQTVLKVLEGTK